MSSWSNTEVGQKRACWKYKRMFSVGPGKCALKQAQCANCVQNASGNTGLPRSADCRSARSPPTSPAAKTPVQAEAGAMPADYVLGSNHHVSLLPSGPEPAGEQPEEFVPRTKLGPGMPALHYGELLANRQILRHKALT